MANDAKPLASSKSFHKEEASFLKEQSFQLGASIDIDTRKLRLKEALWHSQNGWQRRSCIDMLVDSLLLEIAVTIVIASDLVLTILTFTMKEDTAESTEVFAVGAIFLIVLLFDVVLRVVKYRLLFFHRPLNWLECIVALAGCVMLVFEGVERAGCGGPCTNGRSTTGGGTSLGRSIRPTIKAWRIVRTAMQITNTRGGLHKQIDKQTHRFLARQIRLYLNDFFVIPRQNVKVVPGQGILHVEKAQVRSRVLKGLHLPLTITCGIVDLVHMRLNKGKDSDAVKGDESGHKMLVVVENILLVVGPGHHQEMPAPPWDFEAVQQAKKQLVELLTQRLETEAKHKVKLALASAQGAKRRRPGLVSKAIKSFVQAHMEQALWQGIHVSIHNVEIRFEDPAHEFTAALGANVVGGMRIGYITMRVAGVGEENRLGRDSDFRVDGKWRHGEPQNEGSRDTPMDEDEVSKAKTTSFASKKRVIHGVRLALQADGACVFWNIAKHEHMAQRTASDHKTVALPYTDVIEEGSGVDISEFLEDHHKALRRERVRLALCKEVMSRMVETVGHPAAREFARRLRDRVAAHQYVVMPFGCSIHAMVRPPGMNEGASARRREAPVVDASLEVLMMSVIPDVSQAASMVWLFEYVKRWILEDKRYQWKPPPSSLGLGHDCSTLAVARWQYALQRILCCIDPRHHWHSLDWIGIQRRWRYRASYLQALTKRQPNQENISVLQTGLPMKDIFQIRKEAAWIKTIRRLPRSLRHLLPESDTPAPRETAKDAQEMNSENFEVHVPMRCDRTPTDDDPDQVGRSPSDRAVKDQPLGKKSLSVQLHVVIVAVQMGILSPEPLKWGVRVPILLGQATLTRCLVVFLAPRNVWMRLAPPAASALLGPEAPPPQRAVCELRIESVRMVFYAAPSGAWQLRRAFFCGGAVGPRGGRPGDDRLLERIDDGRMQQAAKGAPADHLASEKTCAQESDICVRVADMDFDPDRKGTRSHWMVGACLPAVEVHALKPLLEALLRTIRPKQPPAPIVAATNASRYGIKTKLPRRTANGGIQQMSFQQGFIINSPTFAKDLLFSNSTVASIPTGHSHTSNMGSIPTGHSTMTGTSTQSDSVDGSIFWAKLLELHWQRMERAKAERLLRLTEKATGISGQLRGRRISGSILFLGGVRADVIEPCTQDHWILQAIHLPAGTTTLSYGDTGGAGLQAAFEPLPATPGEEGGLAQAHGWWFQTQAQAMAMGELLRGERIDPEAIERPGPRPDASCALTDAEEVGELDVEENQGATNMQVVNSSGTKSAWRKAVVRSLRYKPRDSEKGLLPTNVHWQPPTKARSVPLCCRDVNLAVRQHMPLEAYCCSKGLENRKFSSGAAPDLHSSPPERLPVMFPMPQAMQQPLDEPEPEEPSTSWNPFGETSYGDVDVWIETLSPSAVGLPRPPEAEDLWVSLGCVALRGH